MEIKRGTVKSFDAGTYQASVQVAGSLAVWLDGMAVARNIPATEMVAGRSCAVVFFDPGNPQDCVVIAVYT
ncbi:MAG: hypothetical protein HYY01_01230 [Chloroflexi bacterium]|nr:hypothetical protein [Chloroflexota bacterium]